MSTHGSRPIAPWSPFPAKARPWSPFSGSLSGTQADYEAAKLYGEQLQQIGDFTTDEDPEFLQESTSSVYPLFQAVYARDDYDKRFVAGQYTGLNLDNFRSSLINTATRFFHAFPTEAVAGMAKVWDKEVSSTIFKVTYPNGQVNNATANSYLDAAFYAVRELGPLFGERASNMQFLLWNHLPLSSGASGLWDGMYRLSKGSVDWQAVRKALLDSGRVPSAAYPVPWLLQTFTGPIIAFRPSAPVGSTFNLTTAWEDVPWQAVKWLEIPWSLLQIDPVSDPLRITAEELSKAPATTEGVLAALSVDKSFWPKSSGGYIPYSDALQEALKKAQEEAAAKKTQQWAKDVAAAIKKAQEEAAAKKAQEEADKGSGDGQGFDDGDGQGFDDDQCAADEMRVGGKCEKRKSCGKDEVLTSENKCVNIAASGACGPKQISVGGKCVERAVCGEGDVLSADNVCLKTGGSGKGGDDGGGAPEEKTNYTPWVIGGLVVAAAAGTYFLTKGKKR